MMAVVLFLIIVTFLQDAYGQSSTLSQKERISILRQELKKEIHNVAGHVLQGDTSKEEEDYVQSQKLPITPIMKVRNKKKSHLLKVKNVSSKVSVKSDNNVKNAKKFTNLQHDVRNSSNLLSKTSKKLRNKMKSRIRKPIEIFYRRHYKQNLLNQPLEWVHCQDMVTPFLTGIKTDFKSPKRLSYNDPTVQRILQLLKVNTTSYGRDDIYSILYQISTLQLRLFQWDVVPLNLLLNVIIKEHKHTFSSLKAGIREIFRSWRMDISNITNLLKQSRIFRPPCVQITKFDGSTKSPKATKYTKKSLAASSCDEDDDCR